MRRFFSALKNRLGGGNSLRDEHDDTGCDHAFTKEKNGTYIDPTRSTVKNGHIVLTERQRVSESCEHCGVAGRDGTPVGQNWSFAHPPSYHETTRSLALPIAYEIEPGRSLEDALMEPVDAQPDAGAVIVNRSEQE